MINIKIGDILESKSQTLINTVNCVGVMGKGLALQFKKRFPDMFDDYVRRCQRGEVKLGQPYLYRTLLPPWILNFPTKDHWRSVASLHSIIAGLEHLLRNYREWGIASLAVPPLGCGEGQLEWSIVGPTLYRYLNRMDIEIELFAPYGTARDELKPEFLAPDIIACRPSQQPQRIKPAWVALVEIISRMERQPYHWPIGRTIFQKIIYVATEQGLPTGISYSRGNYGPFAPKLKEMIARLINNGLIVEERNGRMFSVKVGKTFADAKNIYNAELSKWEPIIEKVADLFMRLNTHQAEMVSTVLFASKSRQGSKCPETERELLWEVLAWKQHLEPPMDEKEIARTVRNLGALGWLKVRASEDLPVSEDILAIC
ncbi:MAG: macro domain-containing protein [Pseudomonadota bacterium]|nr:macro domain-containing protein [Pseudomonadota bacterium]